MGSCLFVGEDHLHNFCLPHRALTLRDCMRINRSKSFRKLQNESDKMGTEFVITELKLALSLLDIASHSFNPEQRKRLYRDARKSYDLAFQALSHLTPSEKDQAEIEAKLQELQKRLGDLGTVDPISVNIRNAG